jgi:hypothetical protein
MNVPAELLPYLSEFELPTGARIQRWTSSLLGREGWVLNLDRLRFVYSDGSVGQLPRYRTFQDLGFPGGDDDLKTDDDWRAVAEHERALSELLLLDLESAWELAVEHGAANRHARAGETAALRADGQTVTVIDPGVAHDRGHFCRVRLADGTEGTCRLLSLRLSD